MKYCDKKAKSTNYYCIFEIKKPFGYRLLTLRKMRSAIKKEDGREWIG